MKGSEEAGVVEKNLSAKVAFTHLKEIPKMSTEDPIPKQSSRDMGPKDEFKQDAVEGKHR